MCLWWIKLLEHIPECLLCNFSIYGFSETPVQKNWRFQRNPNSYSEVGTPLHTKPFVEASNPLGERQWACRRVLGRGAAAEEVLRCAPRGQTGGQTGGRGEGGMWRYKSTPQGGGRTVINTLSPPCADSNGAVDDDSGLDAGALWLNAS